MSTRLQMSPSLPPPILFVGTARRRDIPRAQRLLSVYFLHCLLIQNATREMAHVRPSIHPTRVPSIREMTRIPTACLAIAYIEDVPIQHHETSWPQAIRRE